MCTKEEKKEKNEAAAALGRLSAAKLGAEGLAKIGRKGGRMRASNMTPEERSEASRKAVAARWAKRKAEREAGAADRIDNNS